MSSFWFFIAFMVEYIYMKFNWDIVGNANIIEYLQKNLANQQLAHGYLFCGPEQVGKTKTARAFMASILCENYQANKKGVVPCGECYHCQQLAKGIHPDVFWIEREEDKKNISIEQINELRNKLGMSSFLNSYKIAVIEGAEKMSLAAANALLKTLEEPSKKTIIILITARLSFLPATIVSRTQIIRFKPVATIEIMNYLVGLESDRQQVEVAANLAAGRPGLAINLIEDSDLLAFYQERVKGFLRIKGGDISQRFKEIGLLINKKDSFTNKSDNLIVVLDIWLSVLRDLFLIKCFSVDLIKNVFIQSELEKLANQYSFMQLKKLIADTRQTQMYLKQNANQQLAMENLVINF